MEIVSTFLTILHIVGNLSSYHLDPLPLVVLLAPVFLWNLHCSLCCCVVLCLHCQIHFADSQRVYTKAIIQLDNECKQLGAFSYLFVREPDAWRRILDFKCESFLDVTAKRMQKVSG